MGHIVKYKARFFAKGYLQVAWMNFNETFAIVSKIHHHKNHSSNWSNNELEDASKGCEDYVFK